MAAKKICVVGSGNWGSVIAKIVGINVQNNAGYESRVPMYVYEEILDGQKLTEIINTKHENIKYLPGHTLPENVVAVPDVVEAAADADFLIFVVPHQFVRGICKSLAGKVKPTAMACSLIKGLDITDSGLDLISNVIRKMLNIRCAVLMGANIASEVAAEEFCEATIGCQDPVAGADLKRVFQTSYFRIGVVNDEQTVELCGALKNIVATAVGFVAGLGMRDNTISAVIRLGLMEMVHFAKVFDPRSNIETFLQSCGVADVVTTCYAGRNRRVAEAFVTSDPKKTIAELEKEMLNGQQLQGPPTAAEVNVMLKGKDIEAKYPLFTAVHKICVGEMEPAKLIDCLREHPEHM